MKGIKPYYGAGLLLWMRDEQGMLNVLLGKRSIEPGKGKWSIPGGKWDDKKDIDTHGNPDYLKTALRETKEEIKFIINHDETFIHLWNSQIPFFHYSVYAYQLPDRRKFNHNHEFSEIGWFAVDALPSPCEIFIRTQVTSLLKQLTNQE
jgi:ADP-ribose pyrophosphatase YjhB (NUDIX family)